MGVASLTAFMLTTPVAVEVIRTEGEVGFVSLMNDWIADTDSSVWSGPPITVEFEICGLRITLEICPDGEMTSDRRLEPKSTIIPEKVNKIVDQKL